MTKQELIEVLEKQKERIISWSNRMIEQYGENAISNEIKAMNERELKEIDNLITELEKEQQQAKTEKRKKAAAKATETRQKKAKEKIQNAINLLRMKNEEITPYKIAKIAKVSYNTAKKYLSEPPKR